MLQCMAVVGEEWMWLVYRCSHFGGGGRWWGSSTFNAKQCCASESPFFLQSEWVWIKPFFFLKLFHVLLRLINRNLFSCSECLCLLPFFAKNMSVLFQYFVSKNFDQFENELKLYFFCSISKQFKLCIFVCITVRRTDKIKGDKR